MAPAPDPTTTFSVPGAAFGWSSMRSIDMTPGRVPAKILARSPRCRRSGRKPKTAKPERPSLGSTPTVITRVSRPRRPLNTLTGSPLTGDQAVTEPAPLRCRGASPGAATRISFTPSPSRSGPPLTAWPSSSECRQPSTSRSGEPSLPENRRKRPASVNRVKPSVASATGAPVTISGTPSPLMSPAPAIELPKRAFFCGWLPTTPRILKPSEALATEAVPAFLTATSSASSEP